MVIRAQGRLRRRISAPLFLAVSLASLGAFGARVVGSISGFIHLENPVWIEAKDPKAHAYTFREMVPTVPAQYRKLSPYIPKEVVIGLLGTEPGKVGAPITVRVGGGRTTPVMLVATPGTKLIFHNVDAFEHRLHGVGMKEFGPSNTARGAKREWTIPAAGTFEIRDELAPSLRMWVRGEPNLVSATYPNAKGEYALTSEVPGEFQVQAFFAGEKVGAATPVKLAARDVGLPPIAVATPKKDGEKGD